MAQDTYRAVGKAMDLVEFEPEPEALVAGGIPATTVYGLKAAQESATAFGSLVNGQKCLPACHDRSSCDGLWLTKATSLATSSGGNTFTLPRVRAIATIRANDSTISVRAYASTSVRPTATTPWLARSPA